MFSKEDHAVLASIDQQQGIGKPRVIGKIVGGVISTVLIVVTFSRNESRRCCCGRRWWREIATCLCVMGVELKEGGYEKVTYVGGSRKCIVVKEGTGPEEMRRMVTEITGRLPCSPNGIEKLTLVNRAFKWVNPLLVQKLVPDCNSLSECSRGSHRIGVVVN
ncbi:hypothetical protein Cgig2_011752 [Carnegiea gigantea]|uniref:Uncharacterized protein n=1 Tax=Carnegiea gigantea TaxID=171969 RepID=A0A9Q1JNK1_9CARY|nr:hypothetical protein Cgig2_011752 [Carnegiea gigantea]